MRKEAVLAALVGTAATVVTVAMLFTHRKHRSDRRWGQAVRILRKFARDCATPVSKLWHVANDLVGDMQAGLASNEANLTMIPSYSGSLPTGEEKGSYYGINLRGDRFFILRAQLGGKDEPIFHLQREEIEIPPNVMNGNCKELFDLIALELSKFLSEYRGGSGDAKSGKTNLGFSISLPVDHAAAASCKAIDWKRLTDDNTVRTELMKEINQALQKHGVEMQVVTLVDDVVGALAGGRYYSKDSVAAVTLGMTTSVAYTESPQEVQKLHALTLPKSGEMVIHMQWGKFISSHLPTTEFDASSNAETTNQQERIFEKLISGMYLGEVVRKVLVKMAQETALFGDPLPSKLLKPYLLRSSDMAAMHQDTTEDYEVVDEKLKKIFGITDTTPMVREIVAEICDIVAERGARLVGAGIVGIVKKLGRIANKKSIITIDGGLYENYRVFRNYLHSSVWEMLGTELCDNIVIEHSHGGSGAGVIFLAASQTQDSDS